MSEGENDDVDGPVFSAEQEAWITRLVSARVAAASEGSGTSVSALSSGASGVGGVSSGISSSVGSGIPATGGSAPSASVGEYE